MSNRFNSFKEWLLRTLFHGEHDGIKEPDSVMPEAVMPPVGDEPLLDLEGTGSSDVDDNAGGLETENVTSTLPVNSEVEDSDPVKFDDIELVTPLEVMPQKEVVNVELKADTQEGRGQVVVEHETEESASETAVDVPKLVSLTVDSIKYYDKLSSQMPTDDLKNLLDDVCRNLIDNLIISGCTPINEESGYFDLSKHRVEPFQVVEEGTLYSKLIRKGVAYQNEVKLLAIVEL